MSPSRSLLVLLLFGIGGITVPVRAGDSKVLASTPDFRRIIAGAKEKVFPALIYVAPVVEEVLCRGFLFLLFSEFISLIAMKIANATIIKSNTV